MPTVPALAPQNGRGMYLPPGVSWPSGAEPSPPVPDLIARSRLSGVRGMTVGQDIFNEIGTTGLRQYGGFVQEEWLSELRGRKAAWAYREMADNSAVVGAILFAIRMMARKCTYWVEGSKSESVDLIESCMHDMAHSWGDFISEALSFLVYGWGLHEIVYKRRQGKRPDLQVGYGGQMGNSYGVGDTTEASNFEEASSQYDDGKIGWRKLPARAQETLLRWDFKGYSGLVAMEQSDWHGGQHVIPIQKALLFRTETTRDNPEGRSLLRNCFTSYYSIKNIQTIEAIGIERDLAGLPVAEPPEGFDLFAEKNQQLLETVKTMVSSIRRDEDEGVVMPPGWKLTLLNAGGARQIDTDQIIRRYRQEIATTMLADFILVGLDAIGSYAMVDVKSDLFGIAADSMIDMLLEVINKYGIPRLLELNGIVEDDPPRIAHSAAGRLDLEKVGRFLYELSSAGAPIPWSNDLIEQLFGEAGLPATFTGEASAPVEGGHAPEEGSEPGPSKTAAQQATARSGERGDAKANREEQRKWQFDPGQPRGHGGKWVTRGIHAIENTFRHSHHHEHGTSGGSGPSSTPSTRDEQVGEFGREWARENLKLYNHVGHPEHPEAQRIIARQKEIVSSVHRLNHEAGTPSRPGVHDLVVVGSGPGGMTAAIHGATEGHGVVVVERHGKEGGQMGMSSRIENFPGFPGGVAGAELASSMREQAERVGAEFRFGHELVALHHDPETHIKTLEFANGKQMRAKAVVVAGGADARALNVPGEDAAGISYNDNKLLERYVHSGGQAILVGTGNSAGQAAVALASKGIMVTILSRSGEVASKMSDYLVRQVEESPFITVVHGEVAKVFKDDHGAVEGAVLKDGEFLGAQGLGMFIGGKAPTGWTARSGVEVDQRGKIVTDAGMQTSVPGVFAVGDIRDAAPQRVIAAGGEGAMVIGGQVGPYIHGAFHA